MLGLVKRQFASFAFKTRLLFTSMVLYIFLFSIISWKTGNKEFLLYAAVTFFLYFFLFAYYHKLRLGNLLLFGIASHAILHYLGGFVYLDGTRLYENYLIPGFFRYDNLVHTFGIVILTLFAYNLLRPHFLLKSRTALFHFSFLLVLVTMGVGAFSEIIELCAVLWADAAVTVGDYFNNAFDLVWNLTGAVLACTYISWYEYRKLPKTKKQEN